MNKFAVIISLCCIIPILIFAGIAFVGLRGNDSTAEGRVGTSIGDKAPGFAVEDSLGSKIKLADYRGEKIAVITSTASWCPTCIIEAREFTPVWQEFQDSAAFLSVSIDPTDDDQKMEEFKKNYNAPWPHTHPGREGVRQMIKDYKLTRFEITYIIDKDGVIRFRDSGITSREKLKEELEKVASGVALEEIGETYDIQGAEHVASGRSHPAYNSNPPTSGWHYAVPAKWGMYEEELPDEQVIHNLEHGGVWVSYRPDIGGEAIRRLDFIVGVNFDTKVILSPRAKNDSDISLAAWGRLLKLEAPITDETEEKIIGFIERYRNKGPEFIPDGGI